MKKFSISILFLMFSTILIAQESNLYMPLEIQQAYKNGTRSLDGTPGEQYWQNNSDYRLRVIVDPAKQKLKGEGVITYYNNSPDTLTNAVIRLYHDFYKKGAERDLPLDPESLHDGVELTKLSINGVDYKSESRRIRQRGTNILLRLIDKLNPGEEMTVETEWSFPIPKDNSVRTGVIDETSFFIAYWYPQMAVYDDIDGWDRIDYVGHEFYNDFSNFDVEVIVPENYVVWATGLIQNPDEVLADQIAERYTKSTLSDSIIHIITEEDLNTGNITAKGTENVWYYKAENVPDFVFALSDHYLWDGTSALVDNESGRRTAIGAAYNPKSEDFREVAYYTKRTVESLSFDIPAIPFPYPEVTVFNGTGGMEYPMMVNDGSSPSAAFAVAVTAHEVTHMYAPFHFGINERKYSWMDEGFAQMISTEVQSELQEMIDPAAQSTAIYQSFAGTSREMPMMVPTINLHSRSREFGIVSYYRPGVALHILEDLFGREKFNAAFQEFEKRWAGKHPIPYDFFFTFNSVYGEDLSWFWNPWYFDFGYPDLAIKQLNIEEDEVEVTVEKIGILPVPLKVTLVYEDDSEEMFYENVSIWEDGKTEYTAKFETFKKIKSVVVGDQYIPDARKDDNEKVLIKVERKAIELTDEQMQKYIGKYQITDNFVITIRANGGSLLGKMMGQEESELVPYSLEEFVATENQVKLNFEFDENGSVKRMLILQGGMNIPANKVE
ncbi:MAG: DUF3471 domain-containing protein [Melioribacteraceae bacterium]|nr:DUF3471 domain-containing protein [Melioribacteraceae bacterium]